MLEAEDPTLELADPITHARKLLRALDEREERKTEPSLPAARKGRRRA